MKVKALIPFTERFDDGDLYSVAMGEIVEVDDASGQAWIDDGLAEKYNDGGMYDVFRLRIDDDLEFGGSFTYYLPYLPDKTWSEFVNSEYNPIIGNTGKTDPESGDLIYIYRFKILADQVYVCIAIDNDSMSAPLSGTEYEEWKTVYATDKVGFGIMYYNAYFGAECLVAGSKIITEKSAKNVENIKVGDVVKSIDPETLAFKTAEVVKVKNAIIPHDRMFSKVWYKYSFDDGSFFRITGKHRFFDVDTQKYEWAEDIKIGDRVYKMDGTMPKLVSVEKFDEKVEYNTFWNKNHDPYFVDGFLSGNVDTPIPNIKG